MFGVAVHCVEYDVDIIRRELPQFDLVIDPKTCYRPSVLP
jgi:hypothetical protein